LYSVHVRSTRREFRENRACHSNGNEYASRRRITAGRSLELQAEIKKRDCGGKQGMWRRVTKRALQGNLKGTLNDDSLIRPSAIHKGIRSQAGHPVLLILVPAIREK
jgi:hypothetical protein